MALTNRERQARFRDRAREATKALRRVSADFLETRDLMRRSLAGLEGVATPEAAAVRDRMRDWLRRSEAFLASGSAI